MFAKADPARILMEQIVSCRDRGFYALHAFVVMPDHMHVLLTPAEDTTTEKAMQMIKGGASHRIGKELNYKLPIWQEGYHDRWIRDAEEYAKRKTYIEQNPVKAKLAETPEAYAYSSVTQGFELDLSKFDRG